MSIKESIDLKNVPVHVAVIMDGNGRWAKKKGKLRIFGHQNSIKAVRETVEAAAEIGVRNLTLYTFSTENWNRPQTEINALMKLLIQAIHDELKTLQENKIRLLTIGETSKLPANTQAELYKAIDATASNDRMNLIMALSYSSKWEIIDAVKKISSAVLKGDLTPDNINDQLFHSYLSTANIPDPSLLIRTSGEFRISNFLLWQIAYSELYFTDVLWPDFRKDDFFRAIIDYQKRERRFGKTSEQIN